MISMEIYSYTVKDKDFEKIMGTEPTTGKKENVIKMISDSYSSHMLFIDTDTKNLTFRRAQDDKPYFVTIKGICEVTNGVLHNRIYKKVKSLADKNDKGKTVKRSKILLEKDDFNDNFTSQVEALYVTYKNKEGVEKLVKEIKNPYAYGTRLTPVKVSEDDLLRLSVSSLYFTNERLYSEIKEGEEDFEGRTTGFNQLKENDRRMSFLALDVDNTKTSISDRHKTIPFNHSIATTSKADNLYKYRIIIPLNKPTAVKDDVEYKGIMKILEVEMGMIYGEIDKNALLRTQVIGYPKSAEKLL